MHKQNVMKDYVNWKSRKNIVTLAQSNVGTILIRGSCFEGDELLEEDVAFIEVSISERQYADLYYPETGINQNDRMDQERES